MAGYSDKMKFKRDIPGKRSSLNIHSFRNSFVKKSIHILLIFILLGSSHLQARIDTEDSYCLGLLDRNQRENFMTVFNWFNAKYEKWRYGIITKEIGVSMKQWHCDPILVVNNSGKYSTVVSEGREKDGWSNFTLTVDGTIPEVRVVIRLQIGGAMTPEHKAVWLNNIYKAWNNRVKLVCYDKKTPHIIKEYPVIIDIRIDNYFVLQHSAQENLSTYERYKYIPHYIIWAKPTGRSNLTAWALDDPYAPAHEVGHILGNNDEYGIVNGVDFTCTGGHQPGSKPLCKWHNRIMHTDKGIPTLENYSLIVKEVAEMTGKEVYAVYVRNY